MSKGIYKQQRQVRKRRLETAVGRPHNPLLRAFSNASAVLPSLNNCIFISNFLLFILLLYICLFFFFPFSCMHAFIIIKKKLKKRFSNASVFYKINITVEKYLCNKISGDKRRPKIYFYYMLGTTNSTNCLLELRHFSIVELVSQN